ncbi:MAG: radical SAM protein, partial [Anaerolineae bacterium]
SAEGDPLADGGEQRWVREGELLSMPLEDGWEAVLNRAGPAGVAALNRTAIGVLDAFAQPMQPRQAIRALPDLAPEEIGRAIGRLVRAGLLRPAEGTTLEPATQAALSAWLHLTEDCNLSCPYCYVDRGSRGMSNRVGQRAVDRLMQLAGEEGYAGLKLKYAGGEPTLRFPLIRALHERAARGAARMGLALEEVILTNGVGLTDEMLSFVAEAGIRLMVSLDGGPASHDRLRAMPDGRSTYAAVVDGVERALERGLRPNISITLTSLNLNLNGVGQAAAFALDRELPFNLNFYRPCVAGPGGVLPSSLVPDPKRLVVRVGEILALVARRPGYPWPLGGILDRVQIGVPHSYPCSAGRDYLAVDTEGRLAACQMLLANPWSDLRAADPLAAVRAKGEALFQRGLEGTACQACPWRKACAGGCPLLRDTPLHEAYCHVYKALLPQLIRLEVKRLIAARQGKGEQSGSAGGQSTFSVQGANL